jgi:predicted kinase
MATIHFMHGFIGSGKTTIAKRLAADLPAVRLNNDDWMVALYGRGPHGRELHDDYWTRINKLQWDLVRQILAAGSDVILDYGMWGRADRQEWVKRASEFADRVLTLCCRNSNRYSYLLCRWRWNYLWFFWHI